MVVFPKGSILACEHCKTELYEFVVDIQRYERVSKDPLKPIPPHEFPKDHEPALCNNCNQPHGYSNILLPKVSIVKG